MNSRQFAFYFLRIAKNIFDELDADKDGKITQDEF